jgi:DNA-binding MarR family transcriptional regulator
MLTSTLCKDVDVSQVDLDIAVGYVLKRAQVALRAAMDAALREHELSVPQYSCLEQLAHKPGLTNAELARGTFVSRQAMHRLLGTLKDRHLVQGDGGGRHERFALTKEGKRRRTGASAAVAVVEEQMLSPFDAAQRRRLRSDLIACAEALNPTDSSREIPSAPA